MGFDQVRLNARGCLAVWPGGMPGPLKKAVTRTLVSAVDVTMASAVEFLGMKISWLMNVL
jgi:hypothetical protein